MPSSYQEIEMQKCPAIPQQYCDNARWTCTAEVLQLVFWKNRAANVHIGMLGTLNPGLSRSNRSTHVDTVTE